MSEILQNIHSIVAYIFVISTLVLVLMSIFRYIKKMHFIDRQFKLMKISFISAHTQLLLGLIVWIMKGHLSSLINATEDIMKSSDSRLVALEHPMINIIGVLILTIGYFKVKRARSEKNQNLNTILYFGFALLLILVRIPWSQWLK